MKVMTWVLGFAAVMVPLACIVLLMKPRRGPADDLRPLLSLRSSCVRGCGHLRDGVPARNHGVRDRAGADPRPGNTTGQPGVHEPAASGRFAGRRSSGPGDFVGMARTTGCWNARAVALGAPRSVGDRGVRGAFGAATSASRVWTVPDVGPDCPTGGLDRRGLDPRIDRPKRSTALSRSRPTADPPG